MALDTTIIKADNLLATDSTGTNTATPSNVVQITGQNVWEYEFTNTWPEIGVWTVTLNADGFSIPKGTVLGSFSVTQGTVYKMAVNWSTTESVETIATRVGLVESDVAALSAGVTAVENTVLTLIPRVDAAEAAQTTATTTLSDHAAQLAAIFPRVNEVEAEQATANATIGIHTTALDTILIRLADLEAQVTALTP